MKKTVLATLLTCCLLPLVAYAGGHGKPGLWEVSTKMNFSGASAPKIPPEQLAQMKQMGIKIPGLSGDPIVVKQCISKEQAERDEPPRTQNDKSGCEMQNAKRDGRTFTADMVCTGDMKGKGTMKVTNESSESYTGSMTFKGTQVRGGDVEMTNEFSGKWLGADCGDIKPRGG